MVHLRVSCLGPVGGLTIKAIIVNKFKAFLTLYCLSLTHSLACISVWLYRIELPGHGVQGRARSKKLAAPTAHSPAPSNNRRIRSNARFCASQGQYRTEKWQSQVPKWPFLSWSISVVLNSYSSWSAIVSRSKTLVNELTIMCVKIIIPVKCLESRTWWWV